MTQSLRVHQWTEQSASANRINAEKMFPRRVRCIMKKNIEGKESGEKRMVEKSGVVERHLLESIHPRL